jgi:hypothetical protein
MEINGAEILFPGDGGQPEMEQGVENQAMISLFTEEGWAGNFYLKDSNQKVGSDYQKTAKLPIILSNLNLLSESAERALDDPAFGTVESIVTSPVSNQRKNVINIKPPGEDFDTIVLQENGLNWVLQAKKGLGVT